MFHDYLQVWRRKTLHEPARLRQGREWGRRDGQTAIDGRFADPRSRGRQMTMGYHVTTFENEPSAPDCKWQRGFVSSEVR